MRMKAISALWLAALAAGCGSYEVRDTNAAVDRNPMCASRPDRPCELVASDCERETSATWSSERRDSPPVDFRRKRDDDCTAQRPRRAFRARAWPGRGSAAVERLHRAGVV